MEDSKSWNECTSYPTNSLRAQVAEFIDSNPELTHLKDERYYDFEDALMEFIHENRQLIAEEVEREYKREDVCSRIGDLFGEAVGELTPKVLPIEIIDELIKDWDDALGCNDLHWESLWDSLDDTLTDGGVSPFAGMDGYTPANIMIYLAYLKDWYSDTYRAGQTPACIDEFFDNEMTDEETSEYYKGLANDLMKELK